MEVIFRGLSRNDPEDTSLPIYFPDFRNQNEVATLAQLLHAHEYVIELRLFFSDVDDEQDLPLLNWGPLLQVLETREKLKTVFLTGIPSQENLLPMFRNQLFQALQRNSNVQTFQLDEINDFSLNVMEGIVSYFGSEAAFTDLVLEACSAGNSTRNIASILLRNNRIQSLDLHRCEPSLFCPIFQSLASSNSASRLKRLVFCPNRYWPAEVLRSATEGLQSYLESPNATIQCLELVGFSIQQGLSHILRSLTRNTSVIELAFRHCCLGCWERHDTEERKKEFANLLRASMIGLKTLRISGEGRLIELIAELLVKRESNLRCLEFESTSVPLPVYQSLLAAAARSVQLQSLCLYLQFGNPRMNLDVDTLLVTVQSFKGTELALWFLVREPRQDLKERLLDALKNNYNLQSIDLTFRRDYDARQRELFDGAGKAQLEFYLNRNRKLAQWIKNPKLVPQELWSYALDLALKAGINPFLKSLLALSGQGAEVRKQDDKRKSTDDVNPSFRKARLNKM